MTPVEFHELLWDFYAKHGRDHLPWRQPAADGSFDPYAIVVSELMLQQTQVSRVIPKFHEFLMKFPTLGALAEAQLGDVLLSWSGLGYNRRAKFLWQAAQRVQSDYDGKFPDTIHDLVTLPGIGVNTAGAILAYAFNQPTIFIETNVRTVYIHHYFKDHTDIPDKAITPLLEETLDRERPREFYWAMMDYGSHLKQTVGNLSKFSSSYAKQSKFDGSRRQIRGQVLKQLAEGPSTLAGLSANIPDKRLEGVLTDLINEELITLTGSRYRL